MNIYLASRNARAQIVTVNVTDCGFDPHSIYYLFSLQNSVENWERSVLTLSSLSPPCFVCVWDRA